MCFSSLPFNFLSLCQTLSSPLSIHFVSFHSKPSTANCDYPHVYSRREIKCTELQQNRTKRLYLIFFFCFEERCIKLLLPALLSTTIPVPEAGEVPPCTKHIIIDSFTSLDFISQQLIFLWDFTIHHSQDSKHWLNSHLYSHTNEMNIPVHPQIHDILIDFRI